MNKRLFAFLRFIVFNVLFFAVYLNFIYQDMEAARWVPLQNVTSFTDPLSEQSVQSGNSIKKASTTKKTTASQNESSIVSAVLY